MKSLLDFRKTGPTTYGNPITLDELWDRAAALGRVTVDHSLSQGQYVQIRFERKSGTMVQARGHHTEIREAFRLAIQEAVDLGAAP
ncbi:protein of unknown function [Pseudorhizobium banfieldiae]|uniref:Uncharacterized protein n=1 Tax=Pseudorhizobium banfieldiae TaxID=1125847 RepID=L0ND86_9HYPH|nr:hypothetical protein [Pseudorhizobium banfieldiae]CAD6605827.1 hypothetical protein RNT25_01732 [arsenite-oxidising bacterium NT-25]CCF19078.1 protein of unknown function [Pseudorhizobium banfieldiae]